MIKKDCLKTNHSVKLSNIKKLVEDIETQAEGNDDAVGVDFIMFVLFPEYQEYIAKKFKDEYNRGYCAAKEEMRYYGSSSDDADCYCE